MAAAASLNPPHRLDVQHVGGEVFSATQHPSFKSCLWGELFKDKERKFLRSRLKEETVTFSLQDTYQVHVRTLLAEDDKMDMGYHTSQCAVCLHAWEENVTSSWCWTKLVMPLSEKGFSVILVDMPSFGVSTVNGVASIPVSAWRKHDWQIITTILERVGFHACHIVGYGECISTFLRMVQRSPHQLERTHYFHNPAFDLEEVLESTITSAAATQKHRNLALLHEEARRGYLQRLLERVLRSQPVRIWASFGDTASGANVECLRQAFRAIRDCNHEEVLANNVKVLIISKEEICDAQLGALIPVDGHGQAPRFMFLCRDLKRAIVAYLDNGFESEWAKVRMYRTDKAPGLLDPSTVPQWFNNPTPPTCDTLAAGHLNSRTNTATRMSEQRDMARISALAQSGAQKALTSLTEQGVVSQKQVKEFWAARLPARRDMPRAKSAPSGDDLARSRSTAAAAARAKLASSSELFAQVPKAELLALAVMPEELAAVTASASSEVLCEEDKHPMQPALPSHAEVWPLSDSSRLSTSMTSLQDTVTTQKPIASSPLTSFAGASSIDSLMVRRNHFTMAESKRFARHALPTDPSVARSKILIRTPALLAAQTQNKKIEDTGPILHELIRNRDADGMLILARNLEKQFEALHGHLIRGCREEGSLLYSNLVKALKMAVLEGSANVILRGSNSRPLHQLVLCYDWCKEVHRHDSTGLLLGARRSTKVVAESPSGRLLTSTIQIARELLKASASMEAPDGQGKSAVDVAESVVHNVFMESVLLEDCGENSFLAHVLQQHQLKSEAERKLHKEASRRPSKVRTASKTSKGSQVAGRGSTTSQEEGRTSIYSSASAQAENNTGSATIWREGERTSHRMASLISSQDGG